MNNIADLKIGAKIKARRNQLKMTQSALASTLGISFQQVQKYENGKNRISSYSLYLVAQALGVDFSYFFEEFDKDRRVCDKGKVVYKVYDDETTTMIKLFNRLNDRKARRAIINLTKRMAIITNPTRKQQA